MFKPSVSGSNQVNMNIGDAALLKEGNSPGQAGMKTASKLIEDGGEFVRTPMKWVRDMQANWLIYVVCAAIICLCILFFYCTIRRYFTGRRNAQTSFTSQLADIASIMAKSNTNHNCKNSNTTKQPSCSTISELVSTNN